MVKSKSIAGGVLNIIGSVMAFIGTLHLAVCALVKDAAEITNEVVTTGETSGVATNTIMVWIFGIAAFVLAIVAAVFCFKNSLVGGILSGIAAVLLIVVSIIVDYWAWTVIVAMILIAVGCLLAFLVKKPVAQSAPTQTPPQQ